MLSQFCRVFIILLILLAALNCATAQKALDTLAITKALTGVKERDKISDTELNNTMLALDRQFDDVLGNHSTARQGKCIIFRGRVIRLMRLMDNSHTVKHILNDKGFDYMSIWRNCKNDTAIFLSDKFLQSEFDIYYPNGQMPEEYKVISPDTFACHFNLKRIAFCADSMNDRLINVKAERGKDIKELYNYLDRHFLRFDSKQKRFFDEPVQITDVVFSDRYSYVGLDLYGIHYLLAFDKVDNYRLSAKWQLWVY